MRVCVCLAASYPITYVWWCYMALMYITQENLKLTFKSAAYLELIYCVDGLKRKTASNSVAKHLGPSAKDNVGRLEVGSDHVVWSSSYSYYS